MEEETLRALRKRMREYGHTNVSSFIRWILFNFLKGSKDKGVGDLKGRVRSQRG